MFLTLLAVTLLLSATVAWGVTWMFSRPIDRILTRIIADDISKAWLRYMQFAVLVVGVSSGVASTSWSATSPRRNGWTRTRRRSSY